eukprot:TRINITY_DN39760_c0_g1_i2.p1 TRINITY_DN39760_c0_g1~~TRINITY_DN39760_c0_g1_i2.p1  ORF type:complete len:377 (+),score=47.17 TRINITY_DN39760_c0_g1_i2:88-1218(+)
MFRRRQLIAIGLFGGVLCRAERSTHGPNLRQWIPIMRAQKGHGSPTEELAEEHRVVVVMTTIPARMGDLEPVLDSMLQQTWPIAALHLSIPYRYNRTGEVYSIPRWLQQKQGVRIHRCQDLGPGTHLLNGLRKERDPWTFIVIVDDDHIYSPQLVENLMRPALANAGSAVAAQGFLSIPGLEITKDSPRYLQDQGFTAGPVLVSYLGVVYQRGFFDDTVFDYTSTSNQCKYQDDMWFSAHLARKGIKRYVLGSALGVQELTQYHLGPSSLTKWKENRPRQISADCNVGLLRVYPNLWALRRRTVVSVAGLPPVPEADTGALPWKLPDLERLPAWRHVKQVLERLQSPRPDQVYLCTQAGGYATVSPFWFGSTLVAL